MRLYSFILSTVIFTFEYTEIFSQTNSTQQSIFTTSNYYENTFNSIKNKVQTNASFKSCVLEIENNFYGNNININDFDTLIHNLSIIALAKTHSRNVSKYYRYDSINYLINASIFSLIHDTSFISKDSEIHTHVPFTYNFTDPFGEQDYTNTFVTKLLATHQGNCQSLAYLYKILADELDAKCWLSLAPNHIYIKNYSQKIGWYNTELTSGTFPTDAWIMTTSYISPEAVKSGLYMDTLSNQQAIALCVLDLAKCYEKQTKNYYDGFILKCCDLVLQYHPVNPMALLMRAETLKKIYLHQKEIKYPRPTVTLDEMQKAYIKLAKLGYREMSDRMYQKWLKSIAEQKEKYGNKK